MLVEPGDVEAVAGRSTLLGTAPAPRQLGAAGTAARAAEFSVAGMADRTIEVIPREALSLVAAAGEAGGVGSWRERQLGARSRSKPNRQTANPHASASRRHRERQQLELRVLVA